MANQKEYKIKINGISEAIKEINTLDKKTEELEDSLDKLRNDQRLIVNVKGANVEFENLSQAIGEIDDLTQKLSYKLQQMRDAGKENTEEFAKLNAEFQELQQTVGGLEKARKFSDELKDSLSSASRGLDMTVQGFQALVGVLQVGAGAASLFGASEDEINEQMNRMVQLMGIAQGVQELYNQTLKEGTFLARANAAANSLLAKALPNVAKSGKGATLAMKGLKLSLKSIGIGVVISLIVKLVDVIGNFFTSLSNGTSELKGFQKVFDGISNIIAGVSNAVWEFISGPIKTLVSTIDKIIQGDFAGAAKAAVDGIKKQFNVIDNYSKAANDAEKKRNEERLRAKKEIEAKELKYKIDTLEASGEADAKYTAEAQKLYQEYFAAKLLMYEKDSDEYKQVLLEKLKYENELVSNDKANNEKKIQAAKNYANALKEVNDKIQDDEIAAMKDGFQKRLTELKRQRLREIREATEKGIKVKEAVAAINKKYNYLEQKEYENQNNIIVELQKKFEDKIQSLQGSTRERNFNASSSFFSQVIDKTVARYQNAINTLKDKFNEIFTESKEKENSFDKIFKYDSDDGALKKIDEISEAFKALESGALKGGEEYKENLSKLIEETNKLYGDAQGNLSNIKKTFKDLKKTYGDEITSLSNISIEDEAIDYLDKYLKEKRDTIINIEKLYEESNEKEKESYLALTPALNIYLNELGKENDAYQERLNNLKKYRQESLKLIDDKHPDRNSSLDKEIADAEEALFFEHQNRLNDIEKENLEIRNKIVLSQNKLAIEYYKEYFDNLEDIRSQFENADAVGLQNQDLAAVAKFSQSIISINKFKDKYNDSLKEIENSKKDLNKKFEAGIIDEKTFTQTTNELTQLENETKNALKSMEKDWKKWAKSIAEVSAAAISMISQAFTAIADMQANNALAQIEKEKDLLDKQNEILSEKLSEAEEIYSEHNDNVATLQEELLTARGERQNFLMDKLGQEITEREKAWSVQQKIEKQQEQNEKRKQMLEKRQEEVERKRRRQQKLIDIQMAIANTALGVTSALALKPFTLALVMASLAGALGAVQVATIAGTKTYGNGGKLSGPSHAQGGIPVGNTGIEVEGSEYIINKRTTAQNENLLTFINGQKKKLDIDDFVNFFDKKNNYTRNINGNRYANGGLLPVPSINAREVASYLPQENKQYFVSVREIEDVQTHMKQVKAIAEGND